MSNLPIGRIVAKRQRWYHAVDLAPLLLPLILVNAAAVWGQAGWAYTNITDPGWVNQARITLALVFALAIESIGVYLSWEAHEARMANQASGLLQAGAYAVGALAGWLNYQHFDDVARSGIETQAVTFAALSAVSPWLWAVWSRARNRIRLAELELADTRGVKLSTNRKILHPVKSWKVTRWAAWAGEISPSVAVSGWEQSTRARAPAGPSAVPQGHPVTTVTPDVPPVSTADLERDVTRLVTVLTERMRPPPAPTAPPVRTVPGPDPDREPARSVSAAPSRRPGVVTMKKPTSEAGVPVAGREAKRERADRAAQDYRDSLTRGVPLAPADLAALHPGTTESWARGIIRTVSAESANGRRPENPNGKVPADHG